LSAALAIMGPVKFFCEFCGSQVRAADRICPHCGSFFSQVRCPACGFQGQNKLFIKGCPVCGFATATNQSKAPEQTSRKPERVAALQKKEPQGYIIDRPRHQTERMPAWVLPVVIILFLGVIILAVFVMQTRR